ncbi:MAG: FMN-dependent NADH-azoreductase [Chitinophagaceae bacterium]|nr:MAG: FMN-dependent NADH-azoreductase [Chitinophagaceae bacterium]
MKRILHLTSSIQGPTSYSIRLGNALIEKLVARYPGSTVTVVDLVEKNLPHMSPALLQAVFTPADARGAEANALLRDSDEAVAQLLDADILVIGAPMYNFTIPSSLKAWLDHVTRAGITFGYTEAGPAGYVTGKKVYVAMASGGVYSEGPAQGYDFAAPYLKAVLGFLGMTDVTVLRAEGVKLPGTKEGALEKAVAGIGID